MEIKVTKDNFEAEVLKSDLPVLVDFWEEWCGPCKVLGPTINELAVEYEGKFKVGKLDVDAEPELAQQFNVMSIPTMKFFKNGQVVGELVGAAPKPTIVQELTKHI